MSGKMGSKPTGRKPSAVRRQSAKTDGAFGKEQQDQVTAGDANRNRDKGAPRTKAAG